MKKKAAFFLGSGISLGTYPNNISSVYGMTDALFKEKWHAVAGGRKFANGPNPAGSGTDHVTPKVVAFLKKTAIRARSSIAYIGQRTKPLNQPHYEDLFSLVEQAARLESDSVPNLATADFVQNLRRDTRNLWSKYRGPGAAQDPFRALANAACDFIHWAVDDILRNRVRTRQGFGVITEVARATRQLDVFTLNHETHIEDELKSAGYDCDAGFGDLTRGQFRVYQPGWAKKGVRKRVRIFKLHGSLNWYLCHFPGWAQQYAIPLVNPFRGLDVRGRRVKAVEGKAAFLSGTIVKELHYGEGFFSDLFEDFRSHLSKHTHVIFCGYGFGDPGVNLRLDQWAHNLTGGKQKNTLVILTPDKPGVYLKGKPEWLRKLRRRGQVEFVGRYLSQCQLRHLRKYLDPM